MPTLANSINSSQTNIVLSDVSGLPPRPGFNLKIDSEIVVVRAMSGRNLTVSRGASPASHSANVVVLCIDSQTVEAFYNNNPNSIAVPSAGLVKSNGTALVTATPDVDYVYTPVSVPASGLVKSNGTALVAAVADVDYVATGAQLTGVKQLFYRFFSLALNTPAAVGTDLTNHITLFRACTLKTVRISAKTAPVGASLIIDILSNGSTIWSTQGNRLSLSSGSTSNSTTTFNTTSFSPGAVLSISIAQVGSSTPGQDIQVEMEFEMSYP